SSSKAARSSSAARIRSSSRSAADTGSSTRSSTASSTTSSSIPVRTFCRFPRTTKSGRSDRLDPAPGTGVEQSSSLPTHSTLLSLARNATFVALSAGLVGSPAGPPSTVEPGRSLGGSRAFQVGERLSYRARVNFLTVGSASMSVEAIEPVRGRAAYHTVFDVNGRLLLYHVRVHYESWFDTTTLSSLRLIQHIGEGEYDADRRYEFYL